MPLSKEQQREYHRQWYQRHRERIRDKRSGKVDVEVFGSAPWQEFPGMPEPMPLPEEQEWEIERIRREDPFLYFLIQTETD